MDYREIQMMQRARAGEAREARSEAHEKHLTELATNSAGALDCGGDGTYQCLKAPQTAPAPGAKQCVPGDVALVHYTGWLIDAPSASPPTLDAAAIAEATAGAPFDSSRGRGKEFTFRVGARHVIRGWDTGVATMKVGERAYLLLAPDYGYGAAGAADVIPPGSWLLFDVELCRIQETAEPEHIFTTPSLVAGIVTVIICVYYMFIFTPKNAKLAATGEAEL